MDKLFKYCPIYDPENLEGEYSIINLLRNQVTFSTRNNFNDLFDSKIDFIKPSKAEIKRVHSQLKGSDKHEFKNLFFGVNGKENIDDFYQRVNKKFDEYLFFCLTERPDSNLMWSHYANSHKGFCLEWDTSCINAEKVTYQDNIASFELLDVIKMQFGVGEDSEIVGKKIWNALKVKLNEWKYEKEYRVQFGKGMEHLVTDRNSKFTLVSYESDWIKSIIFGCRMDSKAINYLNQHLPSNIKRKYAVEKKSKILIECKLY